jgi:hypothetical protein
MSEQVDRQMFVEILDLYYNDTRLNEIFRSLDICAHSVDTWLENQQLSLRLADLPRFNAYMVRDGSLILLSRHETLILHI